MIGMLAAQNRWMFIVRGVVAILIGVLALLRPDATLAALILVFAAYALVDGVFAVGAGLGAPGGPRWWIVAGGVLGILIGIYAFINPTATAIAVILVIGFWSIIRGAAEVATVVTLRRSIEGTWLYVLSGIASVIFGAFVIVAPGAGALALLWLLGYYAIFVGVMFIAIGVRLRGVTHAPSRDPGGRASAF